MADDTGRESGSQCRVRDLLCKGADSGKVDLEVAQNRHHVRCKIATWRFPQGREPPRRSNPSQCSRKDGVPRCFDHLSTTATKRAALKTRGKNLSRKIH